MKSIHLFFALLLPFCFAFSTSHTGDEANCTAPHNITITSQTDSSISFAWDDCECTTPLFEVYYVRGGVQGQVATTGSSDFTFSGLSSGTYQFYFSTICGTGQSSIIIEEVVMG